MDVRILKEDLEHLLGGCTALEYLCLQVMDGFSSLHIASANVRTIYLHCWCRNRLSFEVFHDMVIENAPFLERLFVLDKEGPTRIRVIDTPKLTVLGYSCAEFSNLVTGSLSVQVIVFFSFLLDITFYLIFVDLCSAVIQKMIPTSLTPSLRTVTILALHSVGPNLDEVVRVLRCFPCTKKLYIEVMLLSC
jgi:hypothetical protein